MCWKWKKLHSLKKILKLFIEFLLSENKIRYKVAFFYCLCCYLVEELKILFSLLYRVHFAVYLCFETLHVMISIVNI